MAKIVGTKEAKEVSFTRRGANQHAHVLIRKSAPAQTENEMTDAEKAAAKAAAELETAKTLKALAGMSDVVKGYVAKMPDDKVHEFMRKAPADQEAEATMDAKKTQEEADAAKALAEGKTAKEVELEKAVRDSADALQVMQKRLDERDATATIEKRARDDFAGYPGGHEAVIPILKAAAALPEAERKVIEENLKAQINMAKLAGSTFGKTQEEMDKAHPAASQLHAKATEVAKEKKISFEAAKGEVLADPANSDLFMAALAEEQRAATAN